MHYKPTFQQYAGTWNRLLCLLFRAYQLLEALEMELIDVWTRLPIDVQQQIAQIWEQAQEAQRMQVGLNEPIQELLLKLSISILMQDLDEWCTFSKNVLLHFVGILSLDI